MASNPQALLVFVIFFVFSLAVHITAARNNPKDDRLQPDLLGHSDRSVIIPGIGRVMLPPKGSHKSFHYNPITGAPRGRGVSIPRFGGPTVGSGSPRSYVPGGDDTVLPNPGVEVPNPVGGRTPTPTPSAH